MSTTEPTGLESQAPLYVRRLQWRYPDATKPIAEPELLDMVKASLSTCGTLRIADESDVLRYVALRILLTPQQKASRLIQGVLVRILSHPDWSSQKRLDFVYKHVVGRPVSPREQDFGRDFPPVPGGA